MVLGRPKSFDCRLDVKITITQNAALETLADWMGVPKAEVVRRMLDVDRVLAFQKELLRHEVGAVALLHRRGDDQVN